MSVKCEADGPILLVTIDRAHAMNAVDEGVNQGLAHAWDRLEQDASIRVAILTGAGERAFCAGADLRSLLPGFRDKIRADDQSVQWTFGGGLARGRKLKKPVIAAINGHALAGGLELALACDIRLCSPNAMFGVSEARWAVLPAAGGTQRLPRVVPIGLAMEMLLTGDPIDAATALKAGLVNRIIPAETLLHECRRVAERIASASPLAVAAIKHLVDDTASPDFERGMALEHAAFVELLKTADAVEGTKAFSQKRGPIYTGR